MKIYIVIDETPFYHPSYLGGLLSRLPDQCVGAALVHNVPQKCSLKKYILRNPQYLRIPEMGKLFLQKISSSIMDIFPKNRNSKNFYSVKSVLKAYNIDFIDVDWDINQPHYINHCRTKDPDVIVSSNSLYFDEKFLSIPKVCCLNRHSALLPSYRGIWPVFHAYRNGEKQTGTSIHVMEKELDAGIVLARRETNITPSKTLADLYEEIFELSVEATLEALEKVKQNDFTPVEPVGKPSYYSFPTKEHWKEIRSRGGKFI